MMDWLTMPKCIYVFDEEDVVRLQLAVDALMN